jgi:hypothetical protein
MALTLAPGMGRPRVPAFKHQLALATTLRACARPPDDQ